VTGGWWVDSDQVRASAPAFTELGDRLDGIFKNLQAVLSAEGPCWGGDEYGQAFEEKYQDPKQNAFDTFPQLSKGLHDVAAGLLETADTADRGEDATHEKFTTK
jgi:uncharacterized protein YukE